MLDKALKSLAIPAGLEPATIGLEGPKPFPEVCAFTPSEAVNGDPTFIEKSGLGVNGLEAK